MRKTLIATLAIMIVVSFTIPVLVGAAESSKGEKVTGTIQNVDAATNTITVETTQGKKSTYSVDTQTTIQVGGKSVALADLKVGQTVIVEAQGSKAVAIEG